jgi:NADPH-dependent 2,4-dienoyl-CoA reductase/sulfur reductase-like enzyme
MKLDSKIPEGPLAEKWSKHKFSLKLVNPANKRKYDIIVVGTGLAGASAAASFGELGYNVKAFCYQDSPEERIVLLRRVVSMPPKIIKMMATVFTVFFMIP